MARLTITLSDSRHRALKEAAARRGTTIGELIEDSLEKCGIRSGPSAAELVARARRRAEMAEDEALDLAVHETREERKG
ncbi:MAG: ribbon-helix-helix protein, CopG family [Myxococcota bacterium]